MPEYTYLLETRLSAAQQNAMAQVREAARETGTTAFLAGGAVRDLTTGSSVRDLDFAIQGNALGLQAALEARGGTLWGRNDATRTLFFWFPGSVRVEVASARMEQYPKPGQPVYTWSGMVDDLHRRDFTANAMALSLNEGSYGLLLDPLNGVADIEARQLRLVSNYGFLNDPSRMVRAVRLTHRLGWSMEERTATRYENAKEADLFDSLAPFLRGYELEELFAEEDALSAMKALEAEGWLAKLLPGWTQESVDTAALENLHSNRIQLLMQGIAPDLTAAHLEIMTAKLGEGERSTLKGLMVRPGLLRQWEELDAASKEFAKQLTGKEAGTPSATWKLLHRYAAEPILWLAHSKKTPAVEAKLRNFFTVWPETWKKVPIAMMLEMRITPELPAYGELLQELFLQQIDGKLETDEQMRAFLEAYSPPAPPPPISLRRTRGKKAEAKGKRKGTDRSIDEDDEDEDKPATARDSDDDEDEDEDTDIDAEVEDEGDEVEPVVSASLGAGKKLNLDLDKVDLSTVLGRIEEDEDDSEDEEDDDAEEDDEAPIPPPKPPVKTSASKALTTVAKGNVKSAPTLKTAAPLEPLDTKQNVAPAERSKSPQAQPSDKVPAGSSKAGPAKDEKTAAKGAVKIAPPEPAIAKVLAEKKLASTNAKPQGAKALKEEPPVAVTAAVAKQAAPAAKNEAPAKQAAKQTPVKKIVAESLADISMATPVKKAAAKPPTAPVENTTPKANAPAKRRT